MMDRAAIVDRNLVEVLKGLGGERTADGPLTDDTTLTKETALRLFESQVTSRHLDLEARAMRARGEGFYTIGSSGHEGNVVLGALTRHTDPALLHYRSGAFFVERARQVEGEDPVRDILLSLAASADDPISGGRHKVFGSVALSVPPMTSTIASHLPRAVGMAFFHERMKRLGLPLRHPGDSIVVCSFGDASANHATATAAFNAAAWANHQAIPLPILFVCEDNGLGISVRTPIGWIERAFRGRRGFRYVRGDGTDLVSSWNAAERAVEICRLLRTPVFLHLKPVRLLGHAGTDVESGYRSREIIEETEAADPLAVSARQLIEGGAATGSDLLELYERKRAEIADGAKSAAARPKLTDAKAIAAPLTPADHEPWTPGPVTIDDDRPHHLSKLLSLGLKEVLGRYPESFVFGEDVAKKGGVYYVTAGLLDEFGPGRVFNTLLDETSILGLALGGAILGAKPIPEIQYLAYLHNAEDQLRGEAASLSFFSDGQFRNPMVVRIAAFGYQKGFGGHFHNDNSIAVLRDIPGLVIAAPSRPADAVMMLRTAIASGRVVAFLEPIALYREKDLHEEGDGLWAERFPAPERSIPIGCARVDGIGSDLAIVSYANGFRMALRAAKRLADEHDIHCRVVDLRWLAPLDREMIRREAERCGRVLVVDEGRRSGGVGEALVTAVVEETGGTVPVSRVAGEDTFIPLGDAANAVLVSEDDIVEAALSAPRPGSATRPTRSGTHRRR